MNRKEGFHMPKVPPNNERWLRGGRLNQKRHLELTEDEKATIALCSGNIGGHPCKHPIFRCLDCGNYGCDQVVVDKCPDQGFKNDKCLHCGAVGTRIPVLQDELKAFISKWEEEVPEIKD